MQKLIFTRLWSAFVSLIDVFGTHRFCSRIEFDVIGTWLPNHSMDAILIGLIDRNKNEKKVKRNRKFSGLLIIRKHHFRTNINWKVDQGPSISKRLTLTDHSLTHHIFFLLAFYDVVSPDQIHHIWARSTCMQHSIYYSIFLTYLRNQTSVTHSHTHRVRVKNPFTFQYASDSDFMFSRLCARRSRKSRRRRKKYEKNRQYCIKVIRKGKKSQFFSSL